MLNIIKSNKHLIASSLCLLFLSSTIGLSIILSISSEMNYSKDKQIKELNLKLYNASAEKNEYISEFNQDILKVDKKERDFYKKNYYGELKQKFREIEYKYKDGELVLMDFSNLNISCEYFEIHKKSLLKDYHGVAIVDKNCDEEINR